ncbi:MAG: hypothetical protein R2800_01395 [Flavipsychrobacter sp.]
MQHEEIEIQLWDYIDGTCNEQDHNRISALINTDAIWQSTYQELLALNNQISLNTAIIKTSDSFAKDVMSNIEQSAKKKRSTLLLDWGIKGVAAFFAVSISSIIIYTLAQADWRFTNTNNPSSNFGFGDIELPQFVANIQISDTALYITSFAVMIMVLVLIEKFLHNNKLKAI